MPIYVYECRKCGLRSEAIEKYNDPAEKPCGGANCDGTARRMLSAGSFKFNCPMPTYQKPKG